MAGEYRLVSPREARTLATTMRAFADYSHGRWTARQYAHALKIPIVLAESIIARFEIPYSVEQGKRRTCTLSDELKAEVEAAKIEIQRADALAKKDLPK